MKSSRKHDGDNAYLHIDYKESKHTAINCQRFIECLPVPSGSLAGEGQLIRLLDWQKQLIKGIWPIGAPPRNEVLLSVARRNGKSVLLAAIMTFICFNKHNKSKPVPGSLMVSCATCKEQAEFVFDIIALWCATVIELDEASDVSHYHKSIKILSSRGSKFKAISSGARQALGGQYAAVLCDEIGHWKKNDLQTALRSGMASTPPDKRLFLQASTCPENQDHWFFDELRYFLNHKESPDHYALVMLTDPTKDHPSKEETWIKSNPSYGKLIHKESFESEYRMASALPFRLQKFVAYRCNAPLAVLNDVSSRFLNRHQWDRCKGESQLKSGEPIVVSWDCSLSASLTAVVAMSIDKPHRTECLFIVPKNVVAKNNAYRTWSEQGYCRLALSDYISKQHIVDEYRRLQEHYDVVASQSDLFGWGEINQIAEQDGVDMSVHIARHTKVSDYNDGLEKLSELIADKNIIHNNPVLTYCVDNLRTKRTKGGALTVNRSESIEQNKLIDGGICLILCSVLVAGNVPVTQEINFEGMIIR